MYGAEADYIMDIDEVDGLDTGEDVEQSLFEQYEQVIFKSIITSFGLDWLVQDQRGGDVDTIHTVRDDTVEYKNKANKEAYENRGEYNSNSYHSHKKYIEKNRETSEQQKLGNLQDAYTGKKIRQNEKKDLDHTISAKEIHDDPGRVLAGIKGEDLANAETNLNPTQRSINRSKKQSSAAEFQKKLDEGRDERNARIKELKSKKKLSDKERKELSKLEALNNVDPKKLKGSDKIARAAYEKTIAKKYYTSPRFLKDASKASLKKGAKMGLRSCLGLLITEVWFEVRKDLVKIKDKMKDDFQIGEFLSQVAESFKNAFASVKSKFKELIREFKDGLLSGILSSISETIINIFFTTAKSIGRILRETWSSIVQAVKIIVFNPDNLTFKDLIKAVAKILVTCASVICGGLVQGALQGVITVPILADVVPVFVGTLVTGVLSVTLVYFIDQSEIVAKLIDFINNTFRSTISRNFDSVIERSQEIHKYASKLMSMDIDKFENDIEYVEMNNRLLLNATTSEERNRVLHQMIINYNIDMPYKSREEMDAFMLDKESVLTI